MDGLEFNYAGLHRIDFYASGPHGLTGKAYLLYVVSARKHSNLSQLRVIEEKYLRTFVDKC